MKLSDVIGLLGGLIGLLGGVAGIAALYYQRKQAQILREQMEALRTRDSAYDVWTQKWERATDALQKIYPGHITVRSNVVTRAYDIVFSEPLRRRIELHLGKKVFFTNRFVPRTLTKDELLNAVVQEVIDEVLNTIEKFKTDHTDWSRALGLVRSN